MRRFWLGLSIITLVLATAAPAPAAEGRTPVFLDGTFIGADGRYIVTRNIVSGGGGFPVITIGATNVDLDLNGFTLFGAPGAPVIELPPPGVFTDVKIHNGTIVGGDSAVRRAPGPPAQRLVIEDLKVREQIVDAIWLDNVETVHVRRTSVMNAGGNGIWLSGGLLTNGSIEHCSINETVGDGIRLETVSAFEVAHNNLELPGGAGGAGGITVIAGLGCLLNQNVIGHAGFTGIFLRQGTGNKLYNNVIRRAASSGILVDAASGDNLILNNVVTESGLGLPPGHGLHVEGFRNHIHGNTLNGNESCGMLFDVPSFLNTFGRNMARGNGTGGGCGGPCALLFPPDSCDVSGAGNDTSTENMIPFLF
jgi:hypothetical protein